MLQGYLLLIFITVAGFCFVHGPAAYLQANLLAMTAMALLYLLYMRRWLSLRASTHGLLTISFSLIFYITLNAGGLASPPFFYSAKQPRWPGQAWSCAASVCCLC